ncbi:36259_t:CDS:2, partial [Racocetra persica]
ACQQYRVRRANKVRKIKTTIVNILGKIAIDDIPRQKASKKEKMLTLVIYICHIITEVFRDRYSKLNQEFAIAVIDMIFNPTITTTSLTGDSNAENNTKQHLEVCKDHSDNISDISHSCTPSSTHYDNE